MLLYARTYDLLLTNDSYYDLPLRLFVERNAYVVSSLEFLALKLLTTRFLLVSIIKKLS